MFPPDPTPARAAAGQLLNAPGYWGTAACPTDGERAVFSVRSEEEANSGDERGLTETERQYVKTALPIFAERLAKGYGCPEPTTP
ncbi:hypothetical protein [Streptomyces sp. NPDC051665]|uniref:hypothetical protein n=1 Tax=Streptomyces sp. NPDC051665 TaxID=3154647 RepID=UPI0034346DBA